MLLYNKKDITVKSANIRAIYGIYKDYKFLQIDCFSLLVCLKLVKFIYIERGIMDINTKKEKGIPVVSVKGRIDAVTAPEFEKSLSEIITSGEKTVLINLENLEYISSAGLRSILATAKRLKSENGKMLFTGLKGPVEEVFKISGFYSIFTIFESEGAALGSI